MKIFFLVSLGLFTITQVSAQVSSYHPSSPYESFSNLPPDDDEMYPYDYYDPYYYPVYPYYYTYPYAIPPNSSFFYNNHPKEDRFRNRERRAFAHPREPSRTRSFERRGGVQEQRAPSHMNHESHQGRGETRSGRR